MLQQADDFAPGRQIAAEHAIKVEKARHMGEPAALFEKADEIFAVGRIIVKSAVDFLRSSPPGTQGLRRERGEVVAALQNGNDFKNMRGRFDKQLFIFGGDLVAHLVVIVINIVNNARQPRIHAPAQHGQQNAVELLHGFGGAIERAHQLFAFNVLLVAVHTHVFGHLALQVENQPVFFTAGGEVQIDADFGQLLVAVHQQSGFGAGDDALLDERVHIGFKPLRFGQPQHGVDVAQAAGAGFHIRLEHRARALRLGMALLHFHEFGFHKSRGVALQAQAAQHLLGHHMAAADKARFEKSGVAGDVVCRAGAQFFDAAHFHRRRQLHIPQALHKKRDLLLLELIKRLGRHNGQIQIGIRIHFIAPEAAGGQEA